MYQISNIPNILGRMTFHSGAWEVPTIDRCCSRWNVTESHSCNHPKVHCTYLSKFSTTRASLRPPGKHGWTSSSSKQCILSSHLTARSSLYDELKASAQSWLHHLRKEITERCLKFRPSNVKYWCQNMPEYLSQAEERGLLHCCWAVWQPLVRQRRCQVGSM